jgi:uncharacterized repeat protein (TIGR01451 family)
MPYVNRVLDRCPACAVVFCIAAGWMAGHAVVSSAQDEDPQTVATATGSGPLETTIVVETLQVDTGPGDQEIRRWAAARRLDAGDEVHYTIKVRNPGEQAVKDIVVTKRLPFGVRYQAGSATGPACKVQFSSDGGATFKAPEPTRAATGTRRNARPAAPPDHTHVRWILEKPLAPKATALLRFRAVFS